MTNDEFQKQLKRLTEKIPFDEAIFENWKEYTIVLSDLLEDSKNILLETLYPFVDDFTDILVPKAYYNWLLRCCVELYNLADKQGITNYSENSLHWSKLSDGLSNSLMNKITSRVGVPKRKEQEETEEEENEEEGGD